MSDIKPLTDTPFESALARLIYAGEALGEARAEEQRLEDERALVKELAIIRVMTRDGSAATRAEKIVESDAEYMAHRITQRASIVARFKADAEYQAAKAETVAASLITPDVFVLSEEIDDLTSLLANANDRAAAHEGWAKTFKQANADLVQANRELAEQLTAANEKLTAYQIAAVVS